MTIEFIAQCPFCDLKFIDDAPERSDKVVEVCGALVQRMKIHAWKAHQQLVEYQDVGPPKSLHRGIHKN